MQKNTSEIDNITEEFIIEALERVDELEWELFNIESRSGNTTELARKIKLGVHSLKGSAGSFGLDFLTTICHNFEDYLVFKSANNLNEKSTARDLGIFFSLMRDYLKNAINTPEELLNEYKQRLESLGFSQTDVDHKTLIIEPSKTLQSIYSKILTNLSVRVSIETDGYVGLGRILKEHFDSLIITHKIKSIDGVALIRSLPFFNIPNKELKITFVTSPSSKSLIQELGQCKVFIKEESLYENLRDHYIEILDQSKLKITQKIETVSKSRKPLRKILCIDDDQILHRILDLSFKNLPNISTKFCLESSNAISMYMDYKPDLILLDVMMEGLSGPEVFAKLKEINPTQTCPVIFLTGKSRQTEIQDLKKLGCIGVISKPFKPQELSEQVHNIWHQYHLSLD